MGKRERGSCTNSQTCVGKESQLMQWDTDPFETFEFLLVLAFHSPAMHDDGRLRHSSCTRGVDVEKSVCMKRKRFMLCTLV